MTGQLNLDGSWGKLTSDQRHLLFHMGGWMIVDLLLTGDPSSLMASCWGGSGGKPRHPDGPAWMTSFETGRGKVVCPSFPDGNGGIKVQISAAQLRAYAAALPVEVRDELAAVRAAARAEQRRTENWCRCGKYGGTGVTNDHSKPFPPLSYHPTDQEDDDHYAECRRIRDREQVALARALQLPVPPDDDDRNKPARKRAKRAQDRAETAETVTKTARKRHTAMAWTTSDMQVIANNLHLSNVELGRKLGRTADAIKHKRRALAEIQGW